MRKGLITLMTVAIALVSVQAFAMAPLIDNMPSVVVGNQANPTGGSQPVKYVYIDAFDLDTVVSDDNTSTPDLVWSYEIVGTPKYTINGDLIVNSAVDNVVDPNSTKPGSVISGPGESTNTFAGASGTTYATQDALNNTVTIRNINLYPYGGSPYTGQSATDQAWDTHMQAVTFWCSDGNLASASTVMFWTDNHYSGGGAIGVQKLSRTTGAWLQKKNDYLNANGNNKLWHAFDVQPNGTFYDHTTTHTTNGSGVCFAVTAAGANWGSVQSPMPYFTLEQNQVYKIRCTMNSSQASVGKTPLWDFILENWNGYPDQGLNLYGMDSFYVDNEGGANTVLSTTAGTEMEMYWAPAAFQTPQWNNNVLNGTGLWSTYVPVAGQPAVPRYAGVRDPCLRFRVLDLDNNIALKNDLKSGDICLQKVIVESIDYSKCVVDQTNIVQIGGLHSDGLAYAPKNASNTVAGGNMIAVGLTGGSASYTAATNSGTTHTPGYVTITPGGSGTPPAATLNELLEITPGTDRNYNFPSNDILDNWPIPWQTDKIYRMRVELDAPDAVSAASPWDVMWLSMEPPTNEIDTESFVSANKAIGSPKQAAKQTYMMFYYSGKQTKSTTANLHYLRWRIRFGNSSALNWPAPSNTNNAGKIRLWTVTVDTVKFK